MPLRPPSPLLALPRPPEATPARSFVAVEGAGPVWHTATAEPLARTASGYGRKLPTGIAVWYDGRWRRVYVMQWSNAGTAYIVDRVAPKGRRIVSGFRAAGDPGYLAP